MKTIEECKNEIASNNNFDTFKRAVRYTFNRELLQSEEEFLNKIIDESMQLYADQQVSDKVPTEEESEYWYCPKCGHNAGQLIIMDECDSCGGKLVHSTMDFKGKL